MSNPMELKKVLKDGQHKLDFMATNLRGYEERYVWLPDAEQILKATLAAQLEAIIEEMKREIEEFKRDIATFGVTETLSGAKSALEIEVYKFKEARKELNQ